MSPLLMVMLWAAHAASDRRGFMLHVESGPTVSEDQMLVEVRGSGDSARSVSPRDDGVHPDLDAGDRRWSASVTDFSADVFSLTIHVGDRSWTGAGEFDPEVIDPMVVVQLQPDGSADVKVDTNVLLTVGPGDQGLARGTLPMRFGWAGWLVLVATGLLAGLAWKKRRLWRLPALPEALGQTPLRRVSPADLDGLLDEGRFVCVGGRPRERGGAWLVEAPVGLLPQEVVALAVRHGAAVLVFDVNALDQRDARPPLVDLEALASGRVPLWTLETSL